MSAAGHRAIGEHRADTPITPAKPEVCYDPAPHPEHQWGTGRDPKWCAGREQDETRPLYEIAAEIRTAWWPHVHGWAEPYVIAMSTLDGMSDDYGMEPATAIVDYFLINAGTWRGPDAVRIKGELSAMLLREKTK